MILAFESTAKVASVALLQGERVLAEYSVDCGRRGCGEHKANSVTILHKKRLRP